MVASTWPSTISTSQSEISTPRSLMLGPTNNWLPGVSGPIARAAGSGIAVESIGTSVAAAGRAGAGAGAGPLAVTLLAGFAAGGAGAYGYGGFTGGLSAGVG